VAFPAEAWERVVFPRGSEPGLIDETTRHHTHTGFFSGEKIPGLHEQHTTTGRLEPTDLATEFTGRGRG